MPMGDDGRVSEATRPAFWSRQDPPLSNWLGLSGYYLSGGAVVSWCVKWECYYYGGQGNALLRFSSAEHNCPEAEL